MSSIAIIPARGGSKRIPRKNIRDFMGKPIIAYSIETALQSQLFDEVMVSTDDEEIAIIARQYGASVPFMRSPGNAGDYATTADVLLEVIAAYRQQDRHFDRGCCIYPTAPLLGIQVLNDALMLMEQEKYDTVFPVVSFSYPIWRSLKVGAANKTEMFWPENLNKRSQDLEPAYHDAGQFYWFNTAALQTSPRLFADRSGVVILNESEVQDIDRPEDWHIAEMKFRMRYE